MAAFRAELQKAHRRHDLALCLLIPGIVVLWVGGLAPADPEELANGYSALLYSLPVIEAILMPVMMAVLASRLWDMEIKGNTAKLLYTLQSRRSLVAGKAVFGVLEVLLVTVLELAGVPVLGRVHGYTEAFPTGQLCYLFVCTLAVDAMLFFGEFLLMLWVGNPLPALCVGIVGALVGLFSAFMPPLASYFVPFGYYIPLSAYEVANWDKATHTVTYGTRSFNWGLLAFTLALGAVLFALAWRKVLDDEVKNHAETMHSCGEPQTPRIPHLGNVLCSAHSFGHLRHLQLSAKS